MISLPFNLFDVLLAAVLVGGIFYGRKRGISEQLFSVLKWLLLLVGCALAYQPAGEAIAQAGRFDLLSAYLLSYLGAALLIFLLFSVIERRLAPKLQGSDVFGRSEYYLGMGSGLIRFACIILMALALLNARQFSPDELRASQRYQEDAYGSNFFPNLHSLQAAVFENSLTGPWIKAELGFLLISPTETNLREPNPGGSSPTVARARGRK